MRIRPANVADAGAIARVHVRSWQVAYRGDVPDDYLEDLDVSERGVVWHKNLETLTNDRAILVGEANGGIRGFASVGPVPDHPGQGELAIYVDLDYWGSGLGQFLLDVAEEGIARAELPRGDPGGLALEPASTALLRAERLDMR